MADLHDLTALEQAAAISRGETTSRDLVEHYLARIESLDATLGAFVTVTAAAARQAAAAPRAEGPLAGVPIAVKDLNTTAGVRTTYGSALLADFVPDFDDDVVRLLRQAGTISLGKTHTPEFGLPAYTESEVAPPARTPWDLSRSAGGSSGGAAAAVAAGLVPFAQGNDGGGSIRIPASVCGLVGLKPTRGRVSNGPLGSSVSGLACQGPLARSVADAAAMLDALSVPQPAEVTYALPPTTSFLLAAQREPTGTLRIGRYRTPVLEDVPVHDDCITAYDDVSHLLEELGHEVVDIDCPFSTDLQADFRRVWYVSAASVPVDPAREHELRPLTRWIREQGRPVLAVDLAASLARLQQECRRAIERTQQYDAVLTPTLAQPPLLVGELRDDEDPARDFDAQVAFTPFTSPYNMSGQPAISLPLHWSSSGLPIGVQLAGRPGDEAGLLTLSAQLERARPWRHRHPEVW